MHRVVTIVGARPQFIKAAVVSRALRRNTTETVTELLVHTGQHYDENMSDLFFREMGVPFPHCNLGVGSAHHGAQTGKMLELIETMLQNEQPDFVLVYGDTNSTLAGALAAAKLHVPVAHVEAGLRSFNRRMPEELNRVLTDHCADLLFAPTAQAVGNLRREGIDAAKIHLVGDVMYDAALHYGAIAKQTSRILEKLGLKPKGYILATVHRAENTDDPARLGAIFEGLVLASRELELEVIVPLHPRTRAALLRQRLYEEVSRSLRLIEPVGYLDMIMLEQNGVLIATDSGGVQKEAFFYKVPCVTLREETEWVELVETGWNVLAPPTDAASIISCIAELLRVVSRPAPDSPYGDGRAASKIVQQLHTQIGD